MMTPRTFLAGWRPALLAGLFAALIPSLHARSWLVDFGPNNVTDGNVTPSGTPTINPGNGSTGVADSNGNYWNNVVGAGATGGPVAMSYLRLIDTANASTTVGLTLGPNWKSNGRNNGGLLSPDAARLGNFAIGQATEDYLFVDGGNGMYATLNLNNLDPGKLYNLRLFGTRNTSDVRKTTYTVSAGNGVFSTVLQTSGADLVSDTDGNDRTIASLNGLQTDATGQLALRVTATEGGFAYLGILELTEADPAPPIVSKTVRVDFGKHDGTNGNPTTSPDAFGNYWNNFGATASGSNVSNLVTTTNAATAMGITLTTAGWQNNGINNGGLTATSPGTQAPLASRLGELAVDTATQDYLFINGPTGFSAGLKVSGLNPSKLYSMRFFGTRNATDVRRSTYTVTAGNGTFAGTLQTTGTGIGTGLGGDDGSTASGIRPDAFGQVWVDLTLVQGSFAYINAMQVTASNPVTVTPLQSWRSSHFTAEELGNAALEATLWGNDADPDLDGRVNLLEYACGTDPRSSDGNPTGFALENQSGNFLTLTYQRNLDATDVSFLVQKADNLADWSGVADSPVSTAGNIETRKASVDRTGFDRLWLRLKVELAP